MPYLSLSLRRLTHRLLAATFCCGLAAVTWGQEQGPLQAPRRSAVSVTPVPIPPADARPRQLAQGSAASPMRLSPQQRRAREEAALEFARQHHPELERLLRQLRGMDPKQYTKAIRDLARVSDRLTALAERNPAQYESQLALWKATSTATLLAARLQLNPDDEQLRQQFREALENKLEMQKQALRNELDRAQQRVDRLQENLRRLDQAGPQMIDRQMRQLASESKSDRSRETRED